MSKWATLLRPALAASHDYQHNDYRDNNGGGNADRHPVSFALFLRTY